MGIFSKFFKKESRAGYSLYMRHNQANFMDRNYDSFSKEAYKKNIIAFQAINKKAKAVAQIPWVIKNADGQEVTGTPLHRALMSPNEKQSLKEWIENTVGYYCISGNIYWEKTNVSRNTPPEFYALRPDYMSIKLAMDGAYGYFKFCDGQNTYYWRDQDVDLIRHIKTFNPLDEIYGMSPIEAAAFSIDIHNESANWLQSLLQNGASPTGALIADDGLTDDEYNRLKGEIEEKYSGSKNAGRPMLLEGKMDWKAIGLSPQNMSIIESKSTSARDIALAFEVPPLLLNIPGDSTYSNYKEARLAFYEESVIPLAQQLVDEFNEWNADRLNGAKVELDLDQVPAIVDKRQAQWEMIDNSSELTINERRKAKGYEEIDGGNALYIDSNKIPLSFDSDLDLDENPPSDE